MASGVEIVGLLLAVLPLFVSAAEHYKSGIGFVRKAVKKEMFAAQYKEELIQQKTLLTLYIKGVVGRTNIPPQTQLILVSDPAGEAWIRPEIVKEITTELAEAYQPFLDAISRICKALVRQIRDDTSKTATCDDIARQLRDLCLEHKQVPSSDDQKSKLLDRIKFSWKSSQRAEILAELQACNKMLEKLSIAADRAKPYIRKQQSRRVHAAYEHREVIQQLFEVLRDACNCAPTAARQVGLRLEVLSEDREDSAEAKFDMILFLSHGVICEVSARIEKAKSEEPPKKKVRILGTGTHSLSTNTSSKNQNMKVLVDICKEVTQAHACQSCLHLVVDKHEKVYCSLPPPASKAVSPSQAQQVLSLTEMMSKLELYNRKRWVHREKSILAIILAYSLLQIHDSPWSQSHWNSNNIAFLDNGLLTTPQPNSGIHLEFRRPYTRSQVATGAGPPANNQSRPSRRNAHFHALGVVLLELHLNRSIQNDVIASGTNDYKAVAQDLLEEEAADDIAMTPEYLKAIRFCLSPHPNPWSGSFSFEDKGFREIYYEEVIAMLEENLTRRFEVSENVWLKAS